MAKQPPHSGSPKDKDDDSWGKLASDLFGIQFGGTDDDFDLPDEESSLAEIPKVAPTPESSAAINKTPTPTTESAPEPDLSFSGDEGEQGALAETRPNPRAESEKDIWDLLESWNWDEPAKETPRTRSEAPTSRRDERGSRRDSGGESRDRSRSREEDRPRRPREREVTGGEEPVRTAESRREDAPRRSESREETPRRERRPVQRAESSEDRPPRSSKPSPTKATTADDDDFAMGLDDQASSRPKATPAAPPKEQRSQPSVRRPAPIRNAEVDEFAGDLFEEPVEELSSESEFATDDEGKTADEERPRRRRRRRRGGRSRRGEGSKELRELEEVSETDSTADEDDVILSDEGSEEASVDDISAEPRDADDEESDERKRPRRRRRRGRRRPEERTTSQSEDADAGEVTGVDDDADAETQEAQIEHEVVAPVSYEGIPTWEEAISYLVRSRGPESRGRGDGASRGRGSSHQRR